MSTHHIDPEGGKPYFVTCTIEGWLWVFASPSHFEIVIDSLKYCRQHKGLLVNAFVVMPNHLHMIVFPKTNVNLTEVLRDFKRHTAREILNRLRADRRHKWLRWFERAAEEAGVPRKHKVWRTDSHPEEIFTEQFYLQKLHYLHNNPVRKGFVSSPEHWLYSSALTHYAGKPGVMEIDFLEFW